MLVKIDEGEGPAEPMELLRALRVINWFRRE